MTPPKETANIAQPVLRQLEKAVRGVQPLSPLDHVAFALLAADAPILATVFDALQRLRQTFVDWNEVRVARRTELARLLEKFPDPDGLAVKLRNAYNQFFETRGCLSFAFLAGGKTPSDAKKALAVTLPFLEKGAVQLLLFEFCSGAPLPLSEKGLKEARKRGLVSRTATRQQLQKRLVDDLPLGEAARLVQYLEIEATAHPYGEVFKPARSTPAKAKKAAKPAAAPKAAKKAPPAAKPQAAPAAKAAKSTKAAATPKKKK